MVVSIFDFEVNRLLIWRIPLVLLVFSLINLESKINWRIGFLGKYTYSFYLLQIFPIALAVKLTKPDDDVYIYSAFIVYYELFFLSFFLKKTYTTVKKYKKSLK